MTTPIDGLVPWLQARLPGASQLAVSDVSEPAQGFSSKTVLFTATWQEHGRGQAVARSQARALVARIQRDAACPMLADVFHQYRVMAAVAASSDAPVPRLFAAEPDPTVIGQPFFVMDRVQGRVPPDVPSYHVQGWFSDTLSTAQREQAWWNAISAMACLHAIGWQAFPFLTLGTAQPPGAVFYIDHFLRPWLSWASQGRRYALLDAAMQHLRAHAPAAEPPSLVWNDARMGNTMFAPDLAVASLFDFEVATLGTPEIDLAWWLYAEDIFSLPQGIARIAGIPPRDEAVRGFERLYGRAMPHFPYYEALAALKHAVISVRDYRNGKQARQPEALPNFATARLQQYLQQQGIRWDTA